MLDKILNGDPLNISDIESKTIALTEKMYVFHYIRTNLTQIISYRTKKPRIKRGFNMEPNEKLVVIANQNFGNLYRVCCSTFANVVSNNP